MGQIVYKKNRPKTLKSAILEGTFVGAVVTACALSGAVTGGILFALSASPVVVALGLTALVLSGVICVALLYSTDIYDDIMDRPPLDTPLALQVLFVFTTVFFLTLFAPAVQTMAFIQVFFLNNPFKPSKPKDVRRTIVNTYHGMCHS